MSQIPMNRRAALKILGAGGLYLPFGIRTSTAAPSETVRHVSFGAAGMGWSDISSLSASPHFKLVAVADVDLGRVGDVKKRFPDAKIYQDWRELLDKEKGIDSANISTPDHMHAPISTATMQRGINVYTQKPLTQTIYEARQLTKLAEEKKLVTQMGIQIHSHPVHKQVVAIIQDGAIGKVKEAHSWSGKSWGDRNPRPNRTDPVPKDFDWNGWLGVAQDRPFLRGYYHPGEWRKRLDFGTGTFGDMGCHILDPVFTALALITPVAVTSTGEVPNADSWGLDTQVRYDFAQTPHTTEKPVLHWYNGHRRPPEEIAKLIAPHTMSDQGSIYIGTKGVLYSPYIDQPVLLPAEQFKDYKRPTPRGDDHYVQFINAVRGEEKTSAPFSYAGPLTESVLLGCLSTRFPKQKLEWDAAAMKVTNVEDANHFVRKKYRENW